MKVVFGGAFNPVTNAHLKVYEYIMDTLDIEEFIFLPVSSAYTKSDLASNYHRVNMLELATKDLTNTSICRLEIDDTDFLGTYQSLIRLSDRLETDLAFVVGADNIKTMEHWINIEGILSEFRVIVLGREGIDIKQTINSYEVLRRHKDSFIIYDDFHALYSSTYFRNTFDKSIVPDVVYDYIIKNNIYQEEDDDKT